ncbi:MAG: N-acetylmuramoyl-L-alanine amidase [Bacteroidales bacterium]|nr:N-acetylmuramoyl-L-alanine amidase [Bacteroidales bacterium]
MFHPNDFTFSEKLKYRAPGDTKYIILHHSKVTTPHTAADVHQWHLNKGWSGIGYHYFIAKDGEIYEGRPHGTIGALEKSINRKSVGICFEGDFNKKKMTDNQKKSAIILINLLSFTYPDAELCRYDDFKKDEKWPEYNFPFDSLRKKVEEAQKRMGVSTRIK